MMFGTFSNTANIQAEFYCYAKSIGLPVELEVTTPVGRLDIAVLAGDKKSIVAVVEVKRQDYVDSIETFNYEPFQFKRYKSIGVPFYLVTSAEKIPEIANKILKNDFKEAGVKMEDIVPMKRNRRRKKNVVVLDDGLNYKRFSW